MALRSVAALTALALSLPAQDLELTVQGGSVPGQIDWSVGTGQPFAQGGFIILSTGLGPTPLAILDSRDPRSLGVGSELLSVTVGGPFLADGYFRPAPLPVPNMPSLFDAALHMQSISVQGTQYFVDKVSERRTVRFGPAGSWRDRGTAFSSPRSFFPVIDGGDGRALIVGGGSGAIFAQIAQKSCEFYDPATDSFAPAPDLTTERSLHTATRLSDGRWLIVGGVDFRNDPQATAEIWDPVAGTFTAVASMALQRGGHAASLLPDGRVLVTGGLTDLNAPSTPIDPIYSVTDRTEIYDPVADRWSPGPLLNRVRAGHVHIQRADGRVLIAGGVGWRRIIIRIPVVEDTTDLFDPASQSIAAGPNLRNARAECSVADLGNGRWLLAGGVGTISLTQWGAPTASAEIYDEAGNSFAATGSMAQQRVLQEAYPIGGGRVLHVGGGDGTLFALTPLASCEIWDAATGQFSAAPPLTASRAAYGAWQTPTGQFHVMGGSSGTTGVVNSNEVFYR